MNLLLTPPDRILTVADLLEKLGDIPPDRVRFWPIPGTATEKDVLELHDHEDRLFELVDGVLVEKGMGYAESALTIALIRFLDRFIHRRNLGLLTGADGMLRLFPGLVLIPDVAFVSWDRVPGRRMPKEPIPDLIPDLAVEVLSKSNTPKEMARKRQEYFKAGVRRVWEVDPESRTVAVYSSAKRCTTLEESATLSGEPVLPGFSLSLRKLFAELDRQG
jgi:Uma2 family endonuclease